MEESINTRQETIQRPSQSCIKKMKQLSRIQLIYWNAKYWRHLQEVGLCGLKTDTKDQHIVKTLKAPIQVSWQTAHLKFQLGSLNTRNLNHCLKSCLLVATM